MFDICTCTVYVVKLVQYLDKLLAYCTYVYRSIKKSYEIFKKVETNFTSLMFLLLKSIFGSGAQSIFSLLLNNSWLVC